LPRFEGAFDAITKLGGDYQNDQRFKPLRGPGRPLWEFKEHDHRLYCQRIVIQGWSVRIVLLNGWIKDKEGKTQEEARKIEIAHRLLTEMQSQKGGDQP
jgi:hypothetical protein